MAGFEVDTDNWPIVMVKLDGQQTMADCDGFIAAMDALHARKEAYVSISWMRRYSNDRAQVQKFARWMKQTGHLTKQWCVANGIVTQSLGFRFVLSSIFLVRPMPCPYQVCASFDEAASFVREQARRRNMILPPMTNRWGI